MTPEQIKVILSAEDRTAAAFGSLARSVNKAGFNFDTLKAQAVSALGALSVPVTAVGLVTMVNSAREAIDKLKDLEDATGASVEKISALDSIARSTGSNIDTVGAALIKFNMVLKDADPDKGAGAVLKAMNLDIDKLKSLDPAEALRLVAVAMADYKDNGDKARAMLELFGKSTKDVAAFMKDLAEAKSLDAKLTENQIEQVDRFNKEWARLKATAEDASRSFSVNLISELNGVIDKFSQAEKAGKSFLSVLFLSTAEMDKKNRAAGAFGKGPMQDAAEAGAALKALESATFRLSDQDPRMVAARQRKRDADAVLAAAGGGRGFVNPSKVAPDAPSLNIPDAPHPSRSGGGGGGGRATSVAKVEDPDAAYKRYRDNLQKGIEAAAEMSKVETTLRDIQMGRIGAVNEAQRDQLLSLARVADKMEEGKEAAKKQADADRDAAAAKKELQDAGQRYFESTRTDQEKLVSALAEIDRLQRAGAISAETAGRATAAAYTQAAEKVAKLSEEQLKAKAYAGEFQGSFANAATDVIFNSQTAGDAVRNLGIEIAKIIIQREVITPLAKAGGNFLGNLLASYDGGGYTGPGSRSGGLDGKGGFMAVLHPNETVVDHTRGQSLGGGGGSVSISYSIDARNADSGVAERLPAILRAHGEKVKADVFAAIRRGGSAAATVGVR